MIHVDITCDTCWLDLVVSAKTPDAAEFIAREDGTVIIDGDKHFCSPACQAEHQKEAA